MSSVNFVGDISFTFVESTGSVDAYEVALDPTPVSFSTGFVIYMKASLANTGPSTINVNGLGAKDIKRPDDSNLFAGDIPIDGIAHLAYDGVKFQLLGISGGGASNVLIQSGTFWYGISSGVADAYAVTLDPVPTLAAGLFINMKANAANTSASTITVNGSASIDIIRPDGAVLSQGDIPNGSISHLVYDGTNFQLVGVTSSNDSIIQSGSFWYGVSTGSADAYAVTLDPVPTLDAGIFINMKANADNTGASTINVNSLGAKNIKRPNGDDLSAGDIPNNSMSHLIYDGINFQLIGITGATDSKIQSGSFWYGASTGTADAYAVTLDPVPTLAAGLFINMKANADNTGASTINVNSLGSKNIKRPNGDDLSAGDIPNDSVSHLVYDGTNFQLIGVTGSTDSQIQSGSFWYGASTGSANAYAVTLDPVPTLVDGLFINMKADAANTGASNITVNGSSTIDILRPDGTALSQGDIPNASISHLVYDGANFQLTGVTGSSDSIIQSGSFWYGISTGAADAYAVTLDPVPTLTAGLFIDMKANADNTGASTISVNGSASIDIIRPDGVALLAGDIPNNSISHLVYDGTNFQLIGVTGASGSQIQSGSFWYSASTGAANAYAVTLDPAPTLVDGLFINMKANATNTASSTISVNGSATITILRPDGSSLSANDILQNRIVNMIYDGTSFQLLGSSSSGGGSGADETLINKNTSMNFRTSDVFQSQHAGAVIFEDGWLDSFGNPNEQGADENQSSGFLYDASGDFYKAQPGLSNQDSDVNYLTSQEETNYIQQEWTNANQNTSQADATSNSPTVTLSTGAWPTNCQNARILIDSVWYDIATRDTPNTITLDRDFESADNLYDYIIRFSEFASDQVNLNQTGGGSEFGPNLAIGQEYDKDNTIQSGVLSNAFDGNTSTFVQWVSNPAGYPKYLQIKFDQSREIAKIRINVNGAEARGQAVTFNVSGSNTGMNNDFTVIESFGVSPKITFSGPANYKDYVLDEANIASYLYYRIVWITSNNDDDPDGGFPTWYDTQMMERSIDSPINEPVSISEQIGTATDTTSWTLINHARVTENLNQHKFYWVIFNPVVNFGVNTEVKVYNATSTEWRVIAKNTVNGWEYNSNTNDNQNFTGTFADVDDMLHAISQAIGDPVIQSTNHNRMDKAIIENADWNKSSGFSPTINSIVRGVTLFSNSVSQNPSVDLFQLNYDSNSVAMDLKSQDFILPSAPNKVFLWARIKRIASEGVGTFSVSRDGGATWDEVTMDQKRQLTSNETRILRGILSSFSGPSDTNLRARYETLAGETQELHAWGLQARD